MPPRIRHSGAPSYPASRHIVGRSGPNGSVLFAFDESSVFEKLPFNSQYISDVVGNMGVFNPVVHRSISYQGAKIQSFYNNDGVYLQLDDSCDVGHIVSSLPGGESRTWHLLPAGPSGATLNQWASEAYNKFHDQIPSEVAVANFLYELKDMKGLIPKFSRSAGSKNISSNFLGLEFGVKPFISDIKKIASLAESVEKRLAYLRETAGKEVRLSFDRTLGESDISVPLEQRFTYDGRAGMDIVYRRVGYVGSFHASARLVQNLEGLSTQFATMKAFAAAAGFNKPASIVWEAIPYSFVVDWFAHVQSGLSTITIQPFGGEWSLSNVGYSIRERYDYLVYQDFTIHGSNPRMVLLGTVTAKQYVRQPGLPMYSSNITSTLTPKQLALSLALLNQRR